MKTRITKTKIKQNKMINDKTTLKQHNLGCYMYHNPPNKRERKKKYQISTVKAQPAPKSRLMGEAESPTRQKRKRKKTTCITCTNSTIHARPTKSPHLRAPPFIPSEGDQSVLMHCDPSTDWPPTHPNAHPVLSDPSENQPALTGYESSQ